MKGAQFEKMHFCNFDLQKKTVQTEKKTTLETHFSNLATKVPKGPTAIEKKSVPKEPISSFRGSPQGSKLASRPVHDEGRLALGSCFVGVSFTFQDRFGRNLEFLLFGRFY